VNAAEAREHVHRPVMTHDVRMKRRRHNPHVSRYHRFQVWIATRAAGVLSSPEFLWACIILDLLELPALFVIWNSTPPFAAMGATVTYLTQTVIQLVALPILGEQQRLKEMADDEREREHGRTLTAIHRMTREVHEWTEAQNETLAKQDEVLAELRRQQQVSGG
jgi:hypothetical protein